MALVTWTGTVSSTWAEAGNWDTNTIPIAGDSVRFTNTLPIVDCNVLGNTAALLDIDFTNYPGTVTISDGFNLIVAGNILLSTAGTFNITTPATGTLTMSASGTLTTYGRTINCILRLINATGTVAVPTTITVQLADNVTLSKGFTALGSPVGNVVLRSSLPGTQRLLTLQNIEGVRQDIDYLNVIDINGNEGVTMWSYKGATPVNSNNWLIMSTQPVPTSGFGIN
jgi:hypothetical protein